jgi:hypothetical protein
MQPYILVLALVFEELYNKNDLVEGRAKGGDLYGVGRHSYQPLKIIPEKLRTVVGSF